ncbi:MAG: dihydropteroate synthase [Proteobacteria bacterium]|nr:dihydropteroate synthase [Pseudomonadota bacterium]
MIIVGELINASRKEIAKAIKDKNEAVIRQIAKDQVENGADFIDVNAGVFMDKEVDYLKWLVALVQKETGMPCCIDSPNPEAIEAALSIHQGNAMMNSISYEKKRLDALLPVISGTDLRVIALCMSDEGMPETADDRLAVADKLVNELVRNHVKPENIYIDPLVQSISTNAGFGMECLNAIERIMDTFKDCHTICGLSNVSYGLPARPLINRTFMAMAIAYRLDAAIVNPLDKSMISCIRAAWALSGKDKFCMKYIKSWREGKAA